MMVGMMALADCRRAIGVKWPGYGDRKIERVVKAHSHGIGPDLCGRIGRLWLFGMFFIDRNILGRAIDFRSGSMDDPGPAIFERSLADIQGAFDVGVDVTVGGNVGVRDGDESRQVENQVGVFSDGFNKMRITDIPGDDFQVWIGRDILEPSPEVKRIVE